MLSWNDPHESRSRMADFTPVRPRADAPFPHVSPLTHVLAMNAWRFHTCRRHGTNAQPQLARVGLMDSQT